MSAFSSRLLSLLAVFACAVLPLRADFATFNVSAGTLFDATGASLQPGSLVLLIADTQQNGFGTFAAGSSLTVGSFLGGDDQILGRLFTDDESTVSATIPPIELGTGSYSQLTAGDTLALIWFSTLDSSSLTVSAGSAYGFFTGTGDIDGDSWSVPAFGLRTIHFFTDSFEPGSHPDEAGRASLNVTAVPEPATCAIGLAIAALGFAGLRRRRAAFENPARTPAVIPAAKIGGRLRIACLSGKSK